MNKFCFLLAVVVLGACGSREQKFAVATTDSTRTVLHYAHGFSVTYEGNIKRVVVAKPFQGATAGYTYLLVPEGEATPAHGPDEKVIRIPLKSIVCTSTTHIPLLDYLDETDKLVGFPTTDYISSVKTRARVDAGKVQELGVDKGMNLEMLAALKPGIVMGYVTNSDYGQFKKVEDLGIPAVMNAEYLEKHPLGRAEWIKFVALFFDKEKQADSVFNYIEKSYLDTRQRADTVRTRPTVLSGVVYGDAWFLPGGQNYAATLLRDAGCQYLWASDSTNGFLELSFETVYEKAHNADRWIGPGSYNSLKEIETADRRYTNFTAFKEKNIYSYNARIGAKGGSEFLELGYLRPDIILKDLLFIAHPNLIPEHTLFFHKRLVE
jgi:iron complex transport system substrate-binding protein